MTRHRREVAALSDQQRAALEQRRERLERLLGGEVDLVEQHPRALAHRVHQRALHKRKGNGLRTAARRDEQPLQTRQLRRERRPLRAQRRLHALAAHTLHLAAAAATVPCQRTRVPLVVAVAPSVCAVERLHARERLAAHGEHGAPVGARDTLLQTQEQRRVLLCAEGARKERLKAGDEGAHKVSELDGLEAAQEVAAVTLLIQIEHHEALPELRRELLHRRRLAHARLAHEQHGLVTLHGARHLLQQLRVQPRRREPRGGGGRGRGRSGGGRHRHTGQRGAPHAQKRRLRRDTRALRRARGLV